MPYKHQVAGSTPARLTILKALSQVGKAAVSDTAIAGSSPAGPAIFNDLQAILVSFYKVYGVCSLAGRTVVALPL